MGAPDADLELALEAARAAAALILPHFRTELEVREKGPDQPVTVADLAADAELRRRLTEARPDYGWLSEETVDRPDRLGRERVWIVDPLDGTRSFLRGHGEFAVSIALVEAGRPRLGVVHNPAADEAYWAVRGGGAYRGAGNSGAADGERLSVSRAGRTVLASRSEMAAGELDPFPDWEIEPTGSTAYKLARVAAGAGTAFLSRGPKSEWDVCAGALLVEEAGGVVTDRRGERLVFNRPSPEVAGILAAAPQAHAALLGRVRGLPAPDRRYAGGS